jgi:hypothetical protein
MLEKTSDQNGKAGSNFKGFTMEQKRAIQNEQLAQIQYNQQKKQAEKDAEIAYQEQQEVIRRKIVGLQMQQAQYRQQEKNQLAQERLQQAKLKTQQLKAEDKARENPIQDEFFDQFGQSAR